MSTGIKTEKDSNEVTLTQAKEIAKCETDIIYFIKNYMMIQNPVLGAMLFDLRDYQEDIINQLNANDMNCVLAPRQVGKTVVIVAYILHYAIFNPDITVGVAAHKGDASKEIMSRLRYAYEELPKWIKPRVSSYNIFDIGFSNGSKIMSQTTTESTYRGKSISLLFLDEFAFVKSNVEKEFWKSILPTLSAKGSKCIITSTPNGSSNKFAEIWFKALHGTSNFNAIEIKNSQVPDRDEEFKRNMLQNMSEIEYAQEFLNEFVSSSGTLIHSPILEQIQSQDPIEEFGDLRIFKSLDNKKLGVSCDIGTGISQDFTTLQIFDLTSLEQLAEFRNNTLNITDFTKVLIQVFKELRKRTTLDIYYTIEANSIGMGVTQLLRNATDPILSEVEMVSVGKHDGILTTTKSKMSGCTRMKDLIESGRMTIHSKFLISELKFFIKKGASFAAESGKTDDLVMAVVLFANMINELSQWEEDVYDTLNNVDLIGELDEGESDPLPFVF